MPVSAPSNLKDIENYSYLKTIFEQESWATVDKL